MTQGTKNSISIRIYGIVRSMIMSEVFVCVCVLHILSYCGFFVVAYPFVQETDHDNKETRARRNKICVQIVFLPTPSTHGSSKSAM